MLRALIHSFMHSCIRASVLFLICAQGLCWLGPASRRGAVEKAEQVSDAHSVHNALMQGTRGHLE